jgi:hypothetical protein
MSDGQEKWEPQSGERFSERRRRRP